MWDRFMNWLGQLLGPKVISDSETLKGVRLLTSSGEYGKILSTAKLNDSTKKSVLRACDSIYANKARYKKVEDLTGCPWHVVGVIHLLESSLNFKGVLHNGEKIIGTGRKTRLVPAGRGPFYSWETAAVDALKARVADLKPDWDIEQTLGFLEQYNGLGYRRRGILSPYLWSFTNRYARGKFVADGKFDPYAVSKQVGACAVFLGFVEKGIHLEGLTEVTDVENPEPAIDRTKFTHMHPIDWARRELGTKEIVGKKDNPRIRWYHTFSKNIGSKEHPDEVPWCASFINACGAQCGMEISGSALAASYDRYSEDTGDWVEEGDIVTIAQPGRHVTLANKRFNRKTEKTFQGLGGNQGNQVKVSNYSTATIRGARKWKPKPGTITAPISSKFEGKVEDNGPESTR